MLTAERGSAAAFNNTKEQMKKRAEIKKITYDQDKKCFLWLKKKDTFDLIYLRSKLTHIDREPGEEQTT